MNRWYNNRIIFGVLNTNKNTRINIRTFCFGTLDMIDYLAGWRLRLKIESKLSFFDLGTLDTI